MHMTTLVLHKNAVLGGDYALGYGLWQKDHCGMVFDQRVVT